MAKAIDMGGYYRIPCDSRDLNYDKYFCEGDHKVEQVEEYHSHNTSRLDVEGMKELLLKLNLDSSFHTFRNTQLVRCISKI